MKVMLVGSKSFTSVNDIEAAIQLSKFNVTQLNLATDRGITRSGITWAKRNQVPYELFDAKFDDYGKRASKIRDTEMMRASEALVGLWNGREFSTTRKAWQALALGLQIYIYAPGE